MSFIRRFLQLIFPNKEWNYEADVQIALKAFNASVANLEKAAARMDKERAALEAKVARIKERDAALDATLTKVDTIKGRLGWLMGDMEDTTADDAG